MKYWEKEIGGSNNPAVQVKGLKKSYDKNIALNGVSMDVNYGEIFGIIGPDGAGKTSIFRILTTLILADEGSAQVCGFDVVRDYRSIRKSVGYMPGKFSLYQDLSVEENLSFFATLFNTSIKENYHLIKDIYSQIEPFRKRRAGALSGGMKQKLALCCALIHKPNILFLDEPTTGVDPVSRKEFWNMLKELKESGLAIVVSTPYMDEATLCDRIALIKNGKFLDIDTPENIINKFNNIILGVKADNMNLLLKDLRAADHVESCFAFGDVHHLVLKQSADEFSKETITSLKKYLTEKAHTNIEITVLKASVEDCYMSLDKMDNI